MQRAENMATLLKRSDAALYRVFLGSDAASFAQALCHEHCFTLCTVLHAPSIAPDAPERLGSAIHALGTHQGNSWFNATLQQAVQVFLCALPAEPGDALCPQEVTAQVERACETVEAHPAAIADPAPADESSDGLDTDAMEEDGDPIWNYVQACPTREATKCIDIRTALEERVGKDCARKLLARTKPTVAQDASGKKNRVLKLAGSHLKLKP